MGRLLAGLLDRLFEGLETVPPFVQAGDIIFLRSFHKLLECRLNGFVHRPFGAGGLACLAHLVPSHYKYVHYRHLGYLDAESQVWIIPDRFFGGFEMLPAFAERLEGKEFGRVLREAAEMIAAGFDSIVYDFQIILDM